MRPCLCYICVWTYMWVFASLCPCALLCVALSVWLWVFLCVRVSMASDEWKQHFVVYPNRFHKTLKNNTARQPNHFYNRQNNLEYVKWSDWDILVNFQRYWAWFWRVKAVAWELLYTIRCDRGEMWTTLCGREFPWSILRIVNEPY